MDGFAVCGREIPAPLIPIGDDARDRMVRVLAAALWCRKVPPEIAQFREDGFPDDVIAALESPLVREELDELLDLLLVEQQSPAPVAG